ncbi:MAG: hypothetical protein IPM98_19155 [Lewinellaceae bacterium]|nr:hypothetical protein [Lewinellaceae bacterium]
MAGLHRTAQGLCAPCLLLGKTVDLSAETKSVSPSAQSPKTPATTCTGVPTAKSALHLGDEYFSIDLTNRFTFLPGAPDSLPDLPETGQKIGLTLQTDTPEGTLVFQNARIITMDGDRVLENATLVVENNRIVFVGTAAEFNQQLKTQHPKLKTDRLSRQNHLAWLLWTCMRTPAISATASTRKNSGNTTPTCVRRDHHARPFGELRNGVFNAEMLRSGRMTGPRLYSTGTILYGADGDFKAVINSLDDARSTLRRTKAWGAFSVKSYNQPRRDQRQQVIAAAREQGILVVPEGGSFYHNLSQWWTATQVSNTTCP